MIEGGLDAFLTEVVDVREADDVARDLAGGVVTAVLADRADAGQIEIENALRFRRRHAPLEIHELAVEVARDFPREPLVVQIERRGELAEPVERRT